MTETDWIEDSEDYRETEGCPDCWGEGFVVDCFDDVCQGQEWCMHGDGEVTCPTCKGTGEVL